MASQEGIPMIEITQVGKTRHSIWDNKTSSSWTHGIEYRVLEDPDDIYDYVNSVIRKELETDLKDMGEDQNTNGIIDSLARRQWRLEILNVCDVSLNPSIVESCDIKTGQPFKDRLKERTSELLRALDKDRVSISPIVVIDDPHLLIDGYCRHSALTSMGVPKAYGYSGQITAAKESSRSFEA